jgi:hypothetical protein
LKVKVTALPVTAAFQTPTISDGAAGFMAGENTMGFRFKLDRAAKAVSMKIYDADGEVIRVFDLGAVKANKTKTVTWDGMDGDGNPYGGTYKYAVVADGTKTVGGTGSVYAASPFGKGDGSEANPFLVSDLTELKLIKDYNGSYFAQDADIDFSYTSFTSLFSSDDPFTGCYDGNYDGKSYRMMNLWSYTSLFGCVGETGTIQNVTMSNCVLNASGSFLVTTNSGTIANCSINGSIQCSSGSQAAMVAMYNKGQIRNCNVSGSMNLLADKVSAPTTLKAGSIAINNTGGIIQCISSVNFTQNIQVGTYLNGITYEIYTGGITAESETGAFVTLCTFTGTISAEIQLPDTVKDVAGIYSGTIYSGYVAGRSDGYINSCSYAGSATGLNAKGTGNGVVQ